MGHGWTLGALVWWRLYTGRVPRQEAFLAPTRDVTALLGDWGRGNRHLRSISCSTCLCGAASDCGAPASQRAGQPHLAADGAGK